jgi:hypothetical protein
MRLSAGASWLLNFANYCKGELGQVVTGDAESAMLCRRASSLKTPEDRPPERFDITNAYGCFAQIAENHR